MIWSIFEAEEITGRIAFDGNKVMDKDFVMILITSLPKSWDQYTFAYLESSSNMLTLKSHELVAILLEEDRR